MTKPNMFSLHMSGPYRAEGGAVKAVSHGTWYTVALVDKKRYTPEGREEIAASLAHAATHHDELLRVLKRIHEAFEHGIDAKSRYSHEVRAALRRAGEVL